VDFVFPEMCRSVDWTLALVFYFILSLSKSILSFLQAFITRYT